MSKSDTSSDTVKVPQPATLDQVPAFATGMMMMANANAFATAANNAVQVQQCGAIVMNAATAAGVASILGMSSSEEKALFKVLEKAMNLPAE